MALIDSSYFTGEILLTNKDALATDLTQAIDQYEKEILISLLGYKLYKLMSASPTVEPYKSLIEGAEFDLTFAGITQTLKWEGLKNSAKISLIAYYVYYKYQERNFIKPGAVGTNKPKAEAAEIVSPYPKMVSAWNNMVNLYGQYPTKVSLLKPDGYVFDCKPSAYNYMVANLDLFPDWIFTPVRMINQFGI